MQKFVSNTKLGLSDVDQYIKKYDLEKQERLDLIRNLTKNKYQDSHERIYYGMPTVSLDDKIILQYVAYKKHISLIVGHNIREILQDKYPDYNYTDYTVVLYDKDPIPYNFLVEVIDLLEEAYF